ncbi:MAG TPA: sigma factor-like helix-turn-helix DNA-binding protein [Bryobacteraceae bacterium]|jgi:RNA polymerase sigma factor (sigma-70 family)|nr:sigma factor-like helix-turn-helix DNA-binding protein [Bryobacteraceae bacterium]
MEMLRNDYAQAFETGYSATRRFLLARGAPLEEAEEIAQAAWARGWEYRDQLRDPGLVSYWVNSIARNLFRARFRAPIQTEIEDTNAAYTLDLDAIEVLRLLDRCPRRDRELLEQSLQGYSAEEIAQTEGITPTGIRVRLLRVRQALRGKLNLSLRKEPAACSQRC